MRVASFFSMMHSASHGAPLSAPQTLDSWLKAAKGDARGMWLQSPLAQGLPDAQVLGDVAAVGRVDVCDADRAFTSGANRGSIIGNPLTDYLWAGGRLRDSWPAEPDEDKYVRVRTSDTETLAINDGTLVRDTEHRAGPRRIGATCR